MGSVICSSAPQFMPASVKCSYLSGYELGWRHTVSAATTCSNTEVLKGHLEDLTHEANSQYHMGRETLWYLAQILHEENSWSQQKLAIL